MQKNVIIKKSTTKVFQVCISIVYIALFWNLALALELALDSYCGDNVKYGLLSKDLFQRKRQFFYFFYFLFILFFPPSYNSKKVSKKIFIMLQ